MSPFVRRTTRAAAAAAATAALLASAPAALARPAACTPGATGYAEAGSIGAPIEGAVVDGSGRLYVTDLFGNRILRLDRPGAQPVEIAQLPEGGGAGALALTPSGDLVVGGGADPRVFLGDLLRPGYVATVDPDAGTVSVVARGFSAANGLAISATGTLYATNDFGRLIGRLPAGGRVQADWAKLASANGAVLDDGDRYLYVSRTFVNPGVSRIPVDRPTAPESLLDLKGLDVFAAPDGLTLDARDRPVVPLNADGSIIRINAPGSACTLATGLTNPSVVVYGNGSSGFSAGRLFSAGFDGRIREIPAAAEPR